MTTAPNNPRLLVLALALVILCAVATQHPNSPAQDAKTPAAPSVRLAIITEEPSAAVVADVLTAELSPKQGVQLLERNDIDKAYREQALSAGNKDYLRHANNTCSTSIN